jgi:membrane protein DedA with SNARE-associated domain
MADDDDGSLPTMSDPTAATGHQAGDGHAGRQRDQHPEAATWARRSVLIASAVLFVLGTFGSNIGPAWVDERPALVLALSSRNRNLFGAVPFIDLLPYVLIGFTRVLAAGVVLYFLGRWYGRRAIDWTEGQVGEMPAIYRWFQTAVDRAGWAMVLLMPGSNLVCLMAGHRRMEPVRFVSYLVVGIALKLALLWWGGNVFDDQIRSFLGWIEDYQWWVVGGLFALSFLQSAGRVRKSAPEVLHEIENPQVDPPSSDTPPNDRP